MKTSKLLNLLMLVAIFAFIFTGCKKDNSSSSSTSGLTNQQTSQVQNSDVQDAVADRSEQDADNTVDQLQANNYVTSSIKADVPLAITIKVDGVPLTAPDSSSKTKEITLVYTNYADSTSGEKFVYNGEIDVTVSTLSNILTSRVFIFKNFSITTDSTTITVSGTRTVTRLSEKYSIVTEPNGLKGIRIIAKDTIVANTTWALTTTGSPDTLKFTRNVNRGRISNINFENSNQGTKWTSIIFITYPHLDTISWTGNITGQDEAGDNYSKTITTTPLELTWYDGTPVLIAGTMDLTVSSTVPVTYTITFKRDLPSHPFKTLVTVTNNTTGKTHSFDRSDRKSVV